MISNNNNKMAMFLPNVTNDYRLIEPCEIWDIETEPDSTYRDYNNRSLSEPIYLQLKWSGSQVISPMPSGSENGKLKVERFRNESGAFRREEGRWKIALIHSTPERQK